MNDVIDLQGMLYICGTPIGNLEDITLRQLRLLKECDMIACEDTRHTLKLLNHYGIIGKPLTSFHEHNRREKAPKLMALLHAGQTVVLVSDAGMPCISDPGWEFVQACHEAGIPLSSAPGPTAVITALAVSGLNPAHFYFGGFYPKEAKAQAKVLERLKKDTCTCIFYEAPHRLYKTLAQLTEVLGGERRACCVKELTKKHETVHKDSLANLAAYYQQNEPKGEFVLLLEGMDEKALLQIKRREFDALTIEEHVEQYIAKGHDRKEAMKLAAKDRGVSKREIYGHLMKD